MTVSKALIGNNLYELTLTFTEAEDGVNLEKSRNVSGPEGRVDAYAKTFERDVRRNYAHLFPIPDPPEIEEELE